MADAPPLRRLKDGPAARAWDALLKDWPDDGLERPWARVLQALEETQAAEREECAALAEAQAVAVGWMETTQALALESQARHIAAAIRGRGEE